MRRIIVIVGLVCGVASPLLAQQTTGNVTGRMVDARGGAVPGVTVTASNTGTRLVRTDVGFRFTF